MASTASDRGLCPSFGLSEGFWLRMQASHDRKMVQQALEGVLSTIEPIAAPPQG
jgi:plasmid maintenance system antidote protein VapI